MPLNSIMCTIIDPYLHITTITYSTVHARIHHTQGGNKECMKTGTHTCLKCRKLITSTYEPCPAFSLPAFYILAAMSSPCMLRPPPLPTSTATHLQSVQSVLKGGLVCKHVLLEPLLVLVELLAAVLHLLTDLVGPAQRGPPAGRRRDRRVQVHKHIQACRYTHASSHLASKSSLDRGWQ